MQVIIVSVFNCNVSFNVTCIVVFSAIMKKLNIEFAEMLQTSAGRLIDQITVRIQVCSLGWL